MAGQGVGRPVFGGESPCPSCGTPLLVFKVVGTLTPCMQCRALVVVGLNGLRRPTEAEEIAALDSPVIQAAIANVAQYHAVFGPPMNHRDITGSPPSGVDAEGMEFDIEGDGDELEGPMGPW